MVIFSSPLALSIASAVRRGMFIDQPERRAEAPEERHVLVAWPKHAAPPGLRCLFYIVYRHLAPNGAEALLTVSTKQVPGWK